MQVVDQQSYRVGVFDHVPVTAFAAKDERIKPGSPIELTIDLASPAPPSGTRLFLKSDKSAGLFPKSTFPRFVDVPEGADHYVLRIPTLRTAIPGAVKITLTAGNGRHSSTVQIAK